MAVTSIHPIKVTDERAITYIIDDKKTDKVDLTEFYACGETPGQASELFASTRKLGSGRGTILAQHVYQSFAPGELTKEQAFEIGKRLADELLKGEYQYILSTHTAIYCCHRQRRCGGISRRAVALIYSTQPRL